METAKIYIVYAISAGQKTEEQRRKEFAMHSVRNRKFRYFQDFCEFLKKWDDYDYYGAADVMGYFLFKDDARKAVESNMADINEAGTYPYAAILALDTGCMYPEAYIMPDAYIPVFQYNRDKDRYEEMTQTEENSKFLRFLKKTVTGMITG